MFSSVRYAMKLFRKVQIRGFARVGDSLHNRFQSNVPTVAQIDRFVNNGEGIKEMVTMWPDIMRDFMEDDPIEETLDAMKWTTEMLNYNHQNGYKMLALTCLNAYKELAPADHLTEENLRLAKILTWCIDMLETSSFLVDDPMDHAETRWGKACWYKHNSIGLISINDALMMEQILYELLRQHFRDKPYYLDLVESFRKSVLTIVMGQTLAVLTRNFGKEPNLDLFTMDRYTKISKYKTAHGFFLATQLSLYHAGINDPEVHNQVKKVMLEIGHFSQVKNDYLDCFGDQTIKLGTDIQVGHCTWLAVAALQRATPEQRKIFEENFGKNDLDKAAKIKQLYVDLRVQEAYLRYEEKSYDLVNTYIEQISNRLSPNFFFKCRDQIYRRE